VALFQLCELNKRRQQVAVEAGLIQPLKKIIRDVSSEANGVPSDEVSTESTTRMLALHIFCNLPHKSELCRRLLWEQHCFSIYVALLRDPQWFPAAIDVLHAWYVGCW